VRRQQIDWQRAATQDLSAGNTAAALGAYDRHHSIVQVENRANARSALIARYAHDHKLNPTQSQLVMAFTRDDVGALNTDIRTLRQQTGQLGPGEEVATDGGKREFAINDRIRFLKNERDLGVKNGSLGLVQGIDSGVLSIQLDTGTTVHVDTKFYKHLDYGYAATVHKAQGTTVDRAYVLAPAHFDRHTAYVALSRHRDNATVFYATDDFGGRSSSATEQPVKARFTETLSRARPKELAHDYLELEPGSAVDRVSNLVVAEWEKRRNAAVEAAAVKPDYLSARNVHLSQCYCGANRGVV
jgi:ATP-dependent exoDNAse (exonuclease V) alpha subunit